MVRAIAYPVAAVVLRNRQQVKKAATEINSLVPANETLYAVDPDNQPVFFYVKAPIQYVRHVKDLPVNVDYFLVQAGNETEALAAPKFAPRRGYPLARIRTYGQREIILFRVAR